MAGCGVLGFGDALWNFEFWNNVWEENINHEGHNQSAMRTHPGWGECSGIFTGLADADRMLGGCYVNVESRIAVGVDGLVCGKVSRIGTRFDVLA